MEKDCYTIWENCLSVIKPDVETQAFNTWFDPIVPKELEEDILTIEVPNAFFYEWLEDKYLPLLKRAITETLGEKGQLKYSIRPSFKDLKKQSSKSFNGSSKMPQNYFKGRQTRSNSLMSSNYTDLKLRKEYTFENFIEGDCNKLARSTGLAVAQKPGISSFNPLLLHGGVGLGKTHLVQAIANYIKSYSIKDKVMYVSADKFTNQFVDALKNHQIEYFNHIYMQVDVLAIDDIQFLSGKEKIQEIFFHIFNHLHQSGKQIIMTSDRAPKELQGLEDRLLSRFKWGLTADLRQPDLETRMAILQKKLERDQIVLDSEVIEYLAHSIDNNVRELEGAVNSINAFIMTEKVDVVTLDAVKQIVQQIVQPTEDKEISIDKIQKVVGEHFSVSIDMLKAKTRKKEIVTARQIAMYFAKEYTAFSLKSIGYHFGGRDHSTVIHAIQSVSDFIKDKKEMKGHVDSIRRSLGR